MNVIPLQQPEPKRTRPNEPSYLPDGFSITPAIRSWANSKGITRLDERLEHFVDIALAKGYRYADWAAAFRNACRSDWAKLGPPMQAHTETCCKCGVELRNGHTKTRDGKVCDECWRKR